MSMRQAHLMWDQLIKLSSDSNKTLQHQLREAFVSAILDGHVSLDHPLPSSRELSKHLHIARNTVVLAYQNLVDDGYLVTRKRKGYFVNPKILQGRVESVGENRQPTVFSPDWNSRFTTRPSQQRNIIKPNDWRDYHYPFIYGQPDQSLFPINEWRECCRESMNISDIYSSGFDRFDLDDPVLVEQIQTRLLPRRGVWAKPEEILITLGAQNALYLVANLLTDNTSIVGMENPGYPDARNIFAVKQAQIAPLEIDDQGIAPQPMMDKCDYIYVTPSHQSPTTVTMPLARRKQLLQKAVDSDFIFIEDDYECEANYLDEPTPALKSLDTHDRVIYIGSLSKTLAPGLRLGYMVAPAEMIAEARALRRLMFRHTPASIQRTIALFLARGHLDALIVRQNEVYKERWKVLSDALAEYLPNTHQTPPFGGTAFWIKGPENLNTDELQQAAREKGVLLETGEVYFCEQNPPQNYFRLGYSSIPTERIEPGIQLLSDLIKQQIDQ